MFTYALYRFHADDESGIRVCKYSEFTPDIGYRRYSGPNARPSKLIGGFNTPEEAEKLFGVEAEDIKYLLYCYHSDKSEWDEAAKFE